MLEKSIVYNSMHLYLLFPTVKAAVLYPVSIKSSVLRDQFVVIKKKQRFFHSIYHSGCEKLILFGVLCSEF